ncbi:MAG: DUF5719 family protein [Acidimicrobiales bacterium]
MAGRLAVLVAVAALVVGLFQLDHPHAEPEVTPSPAVGVVVDRDATATTWYCPAAPDGTTDVLDHQIIITNPGRSVRARITGYRTESGKTSAQDTPVPAHSQHVVDMADIGAGLGGVTVELSGGDVTVAHRLVSSTRSDQQDCRTEASAQWYFPSADIENNASAKVWLLNPFPTDASVDIRVSTDTFVRIPSKLRGVIVPAFSSRMVDLGPAVSRRAQFSFAVEARGGRVVAELAQTVTGRGLRLQPGTDRPATSWVLADSYGGTGLSEQLHVYNPGTTDTTVTVSVIPNGYDQASFPEPFVLDIAARHYGTVNLGNEARVPPDSLRWLRVDALSGDGVVVTQVVTVTGAGGDGTADTRPPVAGGLASAIGSSAEATTWYVTSLDPGPDSQSVVIIANPSPDAISLVSLSKASGGAGARIADKLEVPPMSSLAVNVSDAATAGPFGLVVRSSTPVIVSARSTSNARADLSMWPALPVGGTITSLPDPAGK